MKSQHIRSGSLRPLHFLDKIHVEVDSLPSEVKAAGLHGIIEVRWFDLHSEATWDPALINDPIIYLPLQRVRKKLGYLL